MVVWGSGGLGGTEAHLERRRDEGATVQKRIKPRRDETKTHGDHAGMHVDKPGCGEAIHEGFSSRRTLIQAETAPTRQHRQAEPLDPCLNAHGRYTKMRQRPRPAPRPRQKAAEARDRNGVITTNLGNSLGLRQP